MRIPAAGSPAWLNGARVRLRDVVVDVADPAFHTGLGLFETLALRERSVVDLELHLTRLREAGGRIGVPVPDDGRLRRVVLEAAAEQAATHAWLKIVCTRGGRWVVFTGVMDAAEEGRSLTAVTLPWRRNPDDPLAGLKSLNYAASVLGIEEARRRGADEGIWLNTRGHLAEGCTSNLFVIEGRKLFTPGVRDGILPGVVRALVLEHARAWNFIVHECKLRSPRLRRAGEAFLTSSLCGVRPLIRFDGRPVGAGVPGPATRFIARELEGLRRRTPAADNVSLPGATRGEE